MMEDRAMDDLVAWLRGVLGEDEVGIRRVDREDYEGPWTFLLADIEAKLAILDLHDVGGAHSCPAPPDAWGPSTTYERSCQTIRLFASAYRDRDGYREEWRP